MDATFCCFISFPRPKDSDRESDSLIIKPQQLQLPQQAQP